MTRQCVGKGSRSYVTQTDLNICTPSSDKHVGCCNWRHGCSEHFTRHFKIHDDLRKQNDARKVQNIRIVKQAGLAETGNWEMQAHTWVELVSQTLTYWSKDAVTNSPVSTGYQTAAEMANLWPFWCCLSTSSMCLCFAMKPVSYSVAFHTSNTAADPSDAPESRYLPSVKSTWPYCQITDTSERERLLIA